MSDDSMAADPITQAWNSDGIRPRLQTIRGGRASEEQTPAHAREPFGLRPLKIRDPGEIPHRQWIYGTQLIRGFVTLLVAPGGTGKSSLLLATCLSIATGRSLLGQRIFQPCNTALLNLEDPQDEIDRRVTALAMHYKISNQELGGRFFVSPPERGVSIAAGGNDGFAIVHPDEKDIIERVRDERIGVLGVDPFSESHTLEENSNPQMIQAAAAWRRVARLGDCAVVLSHHVRKGPVDSIEAARGAKALSDSARIGLLLSSMSEDDASALGIPPEDRLQYVRLDDAKANLAPRAQKATWFHLGSVTLDNADDTYASGDHVAVIEAWEPPNVWDTMPPGDCNTALDRIDAGLPGGVLYTHSRRSPERWAGTVIIDVFGHTAGQAAGVIQTWIRSGLLIKDTYQDPFQRHERTCLRVNHAKRPT